jgi:hypothetical protein
MKGRQPKVGGSRQWCTRSFLGGRPEDMHGQMEARIIFAVCICSFVEKKSKKAQRPHYLKKMDVAGL